MIKVVSGLFNSEHMLVWQLQVTPNYRTSAPLS